MSARSRRARSSVEGQVRQVGDELGLANLVDPAAFELSRFLGGRVDCVGSGSAGLASTVLRLPAGRDKGWIGVNRPPPPAPRVNLEMEMGGPTGGVSGIAVEADDVSCRYPRPAGHVEAGEVGVVVGDSIVGYHPNGPATKAAVAGVDDPAGNGIEGGAVWAHHVGALVGPPSRAGAAPRVGERRTGERDI